MLGIACLLFLDMAHLYAYKLFLNKLCQFSAVARLCDQDI